MNLNNFYLFVFLTSYRCSIFRHNIDLDEDNPYIVETKSYEFYKNKRSEEIRKNCELDEMFAYHMVGDAESLGTPHDLCPSISGGQCCGDQDF